LDFATVEPSRSDINKRNELPLGQFELRCWFDCFGPLRKRLQRC